jgi:ribonuclease HII
MASGEGGIIEEEISHLKTRYLENTIEFGIDEVGRGCLFGPVCVCCVYIPEDIQIPASLKLRDSKKTTPRQRQRIMEFVEEHDEIKYSCVFVDNKMIDSINILQATFHGMHRSIDTMPFIPEHLLIDGDKFKYYDDKNGELVAHKCVPKGDDKYAHISFAANIAKLKRDQYIQELCEVNPWLTEYYGLSSNKGYGTKKHMDGIQEHGITELHRRSFRPCDTACECDKKIVIE